jgi:hypothetical protein
MNHGPLLRCEIFACAVADGLHSGAGVSAPRELLDRCYLIKDDDGGLIQDHPMAASIMPGVY